ncbi:MAG: hypothetical protein ACOY9J_08360 [Pseudomonadota bacterium]
MNRKQITSHVLGVGLALLAFVPAVFATGTDAGTTVNNTATVNYKIGTISQPPVSNLTPDSFVVDRRILLSVAESGGVYTSVAPGSTNQALTFTVTNDTNQTIDMRLTFAQSGAEPFGGTDNFDVAATTLYQDDPLGASPGVWDAGDTVVTYLDEMAEGETRTVFVVADILNTRVNGDLAVGVLTATAREGGAASSEGALITQTGDAVADTQGSIDTVFGDVVTAYSAARDGAASDADGWSVSSADIVVTKTSRVISDPFTGVSVNAKRIPGAVIEYCIAVENNGASAADTVTVTDVVPAGTTFVSGSIRTAVGGAGTVCDATGTTEDDDAAGGDETDPAGGSYNGGTTTVTVNIEPSIASGGGISRAAFRVTID